MGTRSKVDVFDKNDNVIISIYRQFDGDEIMENDLIEFLSKSRLVKRINKEESCPEYQSGMEELAGDLFIFLKKKTKIVMPANPITNNDFAFEYQIKFYKGNGGVYLIKKSAYSTIWNRVRFNKIPLTNNM